MLYAAFRMEAFEMKYPPKYSPLEEARREIAQLKAALIAGQQNCDDVYNGLRVEREEALSAQRNSHAEYMELIMAVATHWEGETRHQTALRYIQERERGREEPLQEEKQKTPPRS